MARPPTVSHDGQTWPVIDVTDARFALPDDAAARAALAAACAEAERRYARLPRFVMRLFLRRLARRAPLLRALVRPEAAYLDGLSTYALKLGAPNLPPPYANRVDREVAASAPVRAIRLRLQQVASLLAAALADDLAAARGAPLQLVNIGGGPAIDSLNALILLRRDRPELLARRIDIRVLDLDDAGPRFGAAALAALRAPDAPLAGLDIAFRHDPYDWNRPAALAPVLQEAAARGAVIAASSEGALFEYGDDAAVTGNLAALRAGGTALVVGSVTSAEAAHRRAVAFGRLQLQPRGAEGFAPLAARAGWRIARLERTPISDQVLLRPA